MALKPEPISDWIISPHAALEMERRGLTGELVGLVLTAPEQRYEMRAGRDVLQSRLSMGPGGRIYLVRVFVDIDRRPAEVVTTYRTSKVSKYWRVEP